MFKHFKDGREITSTFNRNEESTYTVSRDKIHIVENEKVRIVGTLTHKVYPATPVFEYNTLVGWNIAFKVSETMKTVNIRYLPQIELKDLPEATFFRTDRDPAPTTVEIVEVMRYMRNVKHMLKSPPIVTISGKDEQWVKTYLGLVRLNPRILSLIDLPEGNCDKITLRLAYALSGVPDHEDQMIMWEMLKTIPSITLREYAIRLMKEKVGFRKGYTPVGKLRIPSLSELPL